MDYEAPSGSDPEEQPIIKRMLKLKFDITYDAVREVQFCEHRTESPCSEKPLGRTLFLSRVPPWANELGLARIFAINGPVQKVYLSKKASASMSEEDLMDYTGISRFLWPLKDTSGFKFAYVVFEKPSSLKKAILSMDLTHPFILSNDENPIFTGVRKWKRDYNNAILPDDQVEELKRAIESYVHETDTMREDAQLKAEEEAEPDEDGWVTISRKSKKKSTIGAGKSEKVKARLKAKDTKKRKNKELRNFYKFQLKEGKLKKLHDLKEKFEVDKERQRKMVADRKFRPT